MPRKFIMQDEVLLLKMKFNGEFYITETDAFSKTYDTELDFLKTEDRFHQAWRLDTRTMSAPEDVTDQLAEAWVEEFGWKFTPDDEVPAFVDGSDAWEEFCEQYRIKNGSRQQRRRYGFYSAYQAAE